MSSPSPETNLAPEMNPTLEPATARAIAKITFESFRHSQGIPDWQPPFIKYAGDYEQVRHPLDPAAVRESYPIVRQQVRRFLDASDAHTPTRVQKVFERDMRSAEATWEIVLAAGRFRGNFNTRWKGMTQMMLLHTISRDFSFLVGEGGRPRGREGGGESNPYGKYLSHLVYYGILGNATGVTAFDHLYPRMADRLSELPNRPIPVYLTSAREAPSKKHIPLHEVVRQTASVHLEHYPADRERLPERWQHYLAAGE